MYMQIAGGQYQNLFMGSDGDVNIPEGEEYDSLRELWKYHSNSTGSLGLGAHWDSADKD